MTKTLIDLCAGIGGFSLGFERAGFETLLFSEIDTWKRSVIKHNWPRAAVVGDLRGIVSLPGATVISVGSPCQDLSICRFSSGKGLEGSQSSLIWDIANLVKTNPSRYVVIENVGRILNYTEELEDAFKYYKFEFAILDARWFGALTRRKRAFFIGHHRDIWRGQEILPLAEKHRQAFQSGRNEDVLPMLLPWKGGPSLERLGSCLVDDSQADTVRVRESNGISRRLDTRRWGAVGESVSPAVTEWIARQIALIDEL